MRACAVWLHQHTVEENFLDRCSKFGTVYTPTLHWTDNDVMTQNGKISTLVGQ